MRAFFVVVVGGVFFLNFKLMFLSLQILGTISKCAGTLMLGKR